MLHQGLIHNQTSAVGLYAPKWAVRREVKVQESHAWGRTYSIKCLAGWKMRTIFYHVKLKVIDYSKNRRDTESLANPQHACARVIVIIFLFLSVTPGSRS